MKLRIIAGPPTESMKVLGAVPMLISMGDCYLSLQKGVIDGMMAATSMFENNNLYEVTKYHTRMSFCVAYFSMAWNKSKWNSLPPDVQKIIMDLGGYEGSKWYGENYSDNAIKKGLDQMKQWEDKTGNKVVTYDLPKEELARWQAIGAKPVWDAWAAQMEAKGLPGKAVLAEALKLIEETRGK